MSASSSFSGASCNHAAARVLLGEGQSLLRRELPERYEQLVAEMGRSAYVGLERDVTLAHIDDW